MTKHDYAVPHVPAEWAANPHVLRWWGAEQDAVLAEQIKTSAWLYHWRLHPAIEAITVPDTYERWREADSLCVQYAHYNLVMYFGVARAQALGLESLIRRPQEKRCVLCKSGFSESQVAPWAVDRLGGVDAIDFCQECSQNGCYGVPESAATTRSAMIEYATRLASLFGSVPPQGILSSGQPFAGMSADLRRELLELGMTQPDIASVKAEFGSWLGLLIAASVLPNGTQKMARGIRSVAADGHVCTSLGERTIDDWLTAERIPHEKEPRYPGSLMRADFKVGDIWIEYFGLAGDPKYDAKTVRKRLLAAEHNLTLVELYPADLVNWARGRLKLARLIPGSAEGRLMQGRSHLDGM
ncbi:MULTISPECIES: hypothetical protein [Rhodococcus]|uniref:hypothetical protein n=1 Tax=Rhodococcus TaxID=1827 RepID=UPI000FFC23D3|nr:MULTISPECIES: hypothetical protein [Rhodococcus]MBT9296449.1 hypothetical protein [Rhodococcus sp. GOMB7]UDF18687.1 hypothetical protein LE551_15200 [Rhodococcus qingshengii]